MKRDMQVIINVLSALNDCETPSSGITKIQERVSTNIKREISQDEILYHIHLCEDVGFIYQGKALGITPGGYRLTWQGHDYLDEETGGLETWKKLSSK